MYPARLAILSFALVFGLSALVYSESEPIPPGIETKVVNTSLGPIQLHLDKQMLENTHLKRTEVIYSGGPTILKNVSFEDCTLEIRGGSDGNVKALRQALLGMSQPSPNLPRFSWSGVNLRLQ